MLRPSTPRIDIGVSIFLIVVATLVLNEARSIPPGTFEPMGSGPFPRLVAGLIIVLSLIVMAQAVLALRRGSLPAAGGPLPFPLRPGTAVQIFVLTVAYVLVMANGLLGFGWATSAFVFAAIGIYTRWARRTLPFALGFGLLLGFGCLWVFTRLFYVDLPVG